MTTTYESGFKTYLAAKLNPTDVTMTVATAPTRTAGRIYLKSWSQEERISYTGVTGTTLTGLTRWLSKTADPATAGTGLTFIAGTPVKLVAMHDQLPDENIVNIFDGDNTFNGDNTHTGSDDYTGAGARLDLSWAKLWFSVPNLTTAERVALTAENGDFVYDTTLGNFYVYKASWWADVDTGTTTPNGSTTVAGVYEEATVAEQWTASATGTTGARLVPANANLVKTSSGAGDENKLAILNASWVFDSTFIDWINNTYTAGETTAVWSLMAMESDWNVYKTVRTASAKADFSTITWIENTTSARSIINLYLSDNKSLVLYIKDADKKIYWTVVTYSRTTPTYWTEVEISPALDAAEWFSADMLSSWLIVIWYKLGADDKLYAIACSISWTVITAWTPVKMYNTNIMQSWLTVSIAKLTATSFVILWHDDSTDDPIAVPWTIAGVVITAGTAAALEAVTMSASWCCLLCSVSDWVVGAYYDDWTNISFMAVESDWSTITTNTQIDMIAWYIQWWDKAIYIESWRFLLFRMVNPWRIRVLTTNVQDTVNRSAAYFDATCNYCIPTDNDELVRWDVTYLWDRKIALVNTIVNWEDVRLRILELWVNDVITLYDQTIASTTDTHNISVCKLTTNKDKCLITWKQSTKLCYSIYRNTENQYIWAATEVITATNPVKVKRIGNATTSGLTAGQVYYVWDAGAVATTGTRAIGVASLTTNLVLR